MRTEQSSRVLLIGTLSSMAVVVVASAAPCRSAIGTVAAAMMAKGLAPGAALVFLLAGPATNIATMLVVRDLLGKRVLAIYLTSIAALSPPGITPALAALSAMVSNTVRV